MFTPGQVSDMLEVPSSTLRRYVKQFGEHLSEGATRSRGRRYNSQDIDTLRQIRELLAHGRKPDEVGALLQVVSSEEDPAPDTALALVPAISEALTKALDVSQALRSEVRGLEERQTSTLERVDALEAWVRSPWWKKLFTKPD